MAVSYVPEFSYAYSKDFDYRSYLETKSHTDRIEMRIESGVRSLIASNKSLSELNIKVAKESSDRIASSIDRLSVDIGMAARSIDELRAVCEYGFGELSLGLNRIDDSIQVLIQIAKTPDQTWAMEQFSVARDAFRKNLFEESLDYVDRAIDGYGGRSGYRLEHRFYMLRGLGPVEI